MLATWVLIIIMNMGSATAEFYSYDACNAAAKQVFDMARHVHSIETTAECLPTGAPSK